MSKSRELFEKWERDYADDPQYIAYGLLTDITAAICTAMQQQGMKRKDLAERLGVSPQYVTRFLNTPGNTTVHQVVRFAEAVGLHVNLSLQPQPLTSTAKPAAGNRSSLRASRERYAKARIDST